MTPPVLAPNKKAAPEDGFLTKGLPLLLFGFLSLADVANFTGPVVIENEIVAVVQIVAFTDNQRAELLMKSEKAFELISQIIGFAWARGRDVE